MKTSADFCSELQEARNAAYEIFETSASLAGKWLSPQSDAEGEEGWSPQDIALHMVYGDWWLVDGVSQTCIELAEGTSTVAIEQASFEAATAWARLKREQKGGLDLPGPRETAEALQKIGVKVDQVLEHISDSDLAKTTMRTRGPTSISERLQGAIDHTWEHVRQLQTFPS